VTNYQTSELSDRLWSLCERFIDENNISCVESVFQCDHVIVNAYNFIADICEIVGFSEFDYAREE